MALDPSIGTGLQMAMTKKDYDEFVKKNGRRPGDQQSNRSTFRGQVRPVVERSDVEVRRTKYNKEL